MRILVYIEHADGEISDTSFEALSIARGLGGEVEALVCSDAPGALAGDLGIADRVIAVATAAGGAYLPDLHLAALKGAIEDRNPDLILLGYTTAGLDLAAPAATATGRALVGYALSLELDGGAAAVTSQVYGGKLLATTRAELPAMVVMMPGAAKAEDGRADGTPEVVDLALPDGFAPAIELVESLGRDDSDVDLSQAERILCVGRAIGGTDKLPMAEELAGLLGAEIAGSRPVIDAGWMPKARQVGKSGTKVKPRLYFAAGVSGAPEHLEGMSESDLIIAINTDEGAPIFARAHYGAVCDMFDVMPALTEKLKSG